MNKHEIFRFIDHTLLKQNAVWEQIREICQEGMDFGTASVCIPPSFVKQAAEFVGERLPICTVIGFPNGYQTTAVKVFEAAEAVQNGAAEIDMVINIGWANACGEKRLKVIIETCLLTEEEKIALCDVVSRSRAEFIKTSTGFAGGDTVFGNHLSDTQMAEVFTAAMSKGLNLWDTAAVYGMGSSETALGALVRQFPRENIILSTKFTPQIADKQSAQPVSDMLEASLGRLGVDAIDIYWIHNPLDVEKWTPGLIPLLQSGKVKRVGVSNHNLAQIRRANEILNASGYSLSAVQNHYSLLYRASEEAGILDYCRQNNITFFAYMVLEQGALSGRYDSNHPMPAGSGRAESYNAVLPQIERLTAAMKKMGAERNASVAQIAIAWAIA